ncbi:MAG: hypothetical protein ABSE69_00705 [Roseiarcus sp.]|jgi:hypothetical protein
MTELVVATLLFLLLLLSSAIGVLVQRRLPERHRSRETIEAIRLVISILLTFAALVLGLLTSSAKTGFDEFGNRMRAYGIDMIELDQRLREYGEAADPARALLRTYVAASIADTWPDEPPPAGDYPTHLKRVRPDSIEGEETGVLIARLDDSIRNLEPADKPHRQLASLLAARMAHALEQRWRLIETASPTVSWPLLSLMTSWLVMIFAVFGLGSPRNAVVYATMVLCALSISSAVYMILELDGPLSGWIVVSSQPLRDALQHIDAPR